MAKKKTIISPDLAVKQIDTLLDKVDFIKTLKYKDPNFIQWRDEVLAIIQSSYEMPQLGMINISFLNIFGFNHPNARVSPKAFQNMIFNAVSKLTACRNTLKLQCNTNITPTMSETAKDKVMKIFSCFKDAVITLKQRRSGREPLHMNDEYDVQYIMEAFLRIYFDDVRPEEPIPKIGLKRLIIDFLLKNEGVAIEVKFTSTSNSPKQIQEQLIEDIALYPHHPDVKTVMCFIYDPDCRIKEKMSFIEAIEKQSCNKADVYAYISQ